MNWKPLLSSCFITLLYGMSANAQMIEVKERTSGYLGMRNVIAVKPVLGFSRQPQKGGSVNEKSWGLNKGLNVSYERILTNYKSIVLETELSRTSVDVLTDLTQSFASYFNEYNYMGRDGLEYRIIGLQGSPTINEKSIGIKYKKYIRRSAAIAPIGSYIQFGVAMNNIELDFSPTLFKVRTERNYRDDPILWESALQPTSNKTVARASFGGGYSTLVSKNMLLTLGMDFGYLFARQKYAIYSDELTEVLDYIVTKRMKRKYYHNYNFGLAYVF